MDSRRDFRQRILEYRARQNAQRTSQSLIASIGVDELRAIRKLAVDTWGESRASIHMEPGVVIVGYFVTNDDRGLPPQNRAQVEVARGASHREIEGQIRLWRTHQS